jgi:hypothetical protein
MATCKVVVAIDSEYAPCSFVVCRARPDGTWDMRDDENTRLVDSDWNYPSLASHFGWIPCKYGCGTDGTVTCRHFTASQMMESAYDYMACVIDAGCPQIDDPGYFVEAR